MILDASVSARLFLGLRSKIPPAPIVEEGRWTQKTKVMRRGLAPLPEKSRIPGAPVPLVNMSALGKEVTRREPQKKKVSAREQPTARSKNAKRPVHVRFPPKECSRQLTHHLQKSLDSVGQKNKSVKGKRITTRQSTVTLTTPSPSVKHPRSNASVAKTTVDLARALHPDETSFHSVIRWQICHVEVETVLGEAA